MFVAMTTYTSNTYLLKGNTEQSESLLECQVHALFKLIGIFRLLLVEFKIRS